MTRKEELTAEYEALLHAMQTGVAMLMNYETKDPEHSFKHLRVGINSAFIDTGAIVLLLVKKGVITEEEHLEALIQLARNEVRLYTKKCSEVLGKPITLV